MIHLQINIIPFLKKILVIVNFLTEKKTKPIWHLVLNKHKKNDISNEAQ